MKGTLSSAACFLGLTKACPRPTVEVLKGSMEGNGSNRAKGGTSALLVGSDGETRVTAGFKALMKGSIFADAAVFVFATVQMFQSPPGF